MLTEGGLDAGQVGFVAGLDADARDGLLGGAAAGLPPHGEPTPPLAAGLAAPL
ncbi:MULTISPECIES: hypothetical protein [Cryobacterium]|uniref:hypothetical protein n=1 Tax=Cryobacterium TaxID=69578 RepID=UPI00141AD6E3|nr:MULTISPECIES: hypothetical protein [Cryobacterium]